MIGRKSPAFYYSRKHRSSGFSRTRARLVTLLVPLCFGASFASAQTSTVGQWSPVTTWSYKLIHAHLLPTGKVLFWPRNDTSQLWDPATNAFTGVPASGANIFCSGHSFLADGRLLVTG